MLYSVLHQLTKGSKQMSNATVKQVREIIKSQYNYWTTYNDLRKDKKTRRIKCMINGYIYSPEEYEKWDTEIKRQMDEAGIAYKEAGFKDGYMDYRGAYVYYSVVLDA
jgi:hypothetical protein